MFFLEQALNEVYFGESKQIKELFSIFSKFRNKYTKSDDIFFNKLSPLDVNMDKDLYELNKKIKEFFGFNQFEFSITQSTLTNAFTLPAGPMIGDYNLEKDLRVNKNTFKYNDKYNIVVFMTSALFINEKFTNRECFGILLHEIGHNFNTAISPFSNSLASADKLLNVLSIITNPMQIFYITKFSRDLLVQVTKELREKDLISFIYNVGAVVFSLGRGISREFYGFISLLVWPINISTMVLQSLYKILNLKSVSVFRTYHSEKLSDNFATMYGFGPDVISAVDKINKTKGDSSSYRFLNSIPIISQYTDIFVCFKDLINSPLSSHPTILQRLNTQLVYLKKELNEENCTAETRKIIMSDIKRLEDKMKEYQENVIKIEDNESVRRGYEKVIFNIFGGDIKELITPKNIHKTEKEAYDKAIMNSEK